MTKLTPNIPSYDLQPFRPDAVPATVQSMSLPAPVSKAPRELETALLDHNPNVSPEVAFLADALRRYKLSVHTTRLY